ncbi:glycoside hydrolase family 47 protein [Sphingosinithalassobacter portus]|uniref:glycoside hydrolase family 47 protein n=1 Tax=Stakelama portus TaxID=2676234 RepID=UPI0013DE5CEA|nr:glycoside hydrolase family 47 protein [Sphingosinithalassobacter portus]
MRFNRRWLLRGSLGCAGLAMAPSVAARAAKRDWAALGEAVKAEMAWAFDQYREHAWGKDEIKPVSGTTSSFPLKHAHLGLSLIESLDTLWLMGLDDRFQAGVDWVKAELDFDVDGEVSVFETTIRLLGGLLSAHLACGDRVLLAKAKDLADRMLPAFDTPTGLPYRYVNLRSGAVRDPLTNPAEAGTLLSEWGTLSRLTGDSRYHDATRAPMATLFEKRSKIDLVPVKIDAMTGQWVDRRATVGSYADSYYEYLWDAWELFGDAECKAMYDVLTGGIVRHQLVWTKGGAWIADVDYETGEILTGEQDELSAFYGGLLAQGGMPATGAALVESWAKVQDRYGVLPEAYDYQTGQPLQKTNALRPELADAAFNLWLLDRDERWREVCAVHFENMLAANKAQYGYTDLADVTANPKRQADHCPGYWWSEQMKYYWLIFADCPRFDYRSNVLTTEGNVLRGFIAP